MTEPKTPTACCFHTLTNLRSMCECDCHKPSTFVSSEEKMETNSREIIEKALLVARTVVCVHCCAEHLAWEAPIEQHSGMCQKIQKALIVLPLIK